MSLPSRNCATCRRPFTWRRKWTRDWHAVRYCSDACRGRRGVAEVRTPDGVAVSNAADTVAAAAASRRSAGRALPRGRR